MEVGEPTEAEHLAERSKREASWWWACIQSDIVPPEFEFHSDHFREIIKK